MKLSRDLAGGDPDTLHGSAALGSRDAIVERLPLVRDHDPVDEGDSVREEPAGEADIAQGQGGDEGHAKLYAVSVKL